MRQRDRKIDRQTFERRTHSRQNEWYVQLLLLLLGRFMLSTPLLPYGLRSDTHTTQTNRRTPWFYCRRLYIIWIYFGFCAICFRLVVRAYVSKCVNLDNFICQTINLATYVRRDGMLEDKNENDNLIPHLRVKNNKNLKFEKSLIDGKSQREERKKIPNHT